MNTWYILIGLGVLAIVALPAVFLFLPQFDNWMQGHGGEDD